MQKEKKLCRKREKKTPLNAFRYICSGEAAGEAVSADIPERKKRITSEKS